MSRAGRGTPTSTSTPGAPGAGAGAADDPQALYRREFGYVWHGLRRLGIPERDLPDLTHDVFVTVFRRLPTYDPARPFRPWLFGVLFRVALDHLRLARHAKEHLPEDFDPPDTAPAPDEQVFDREAWRLVDRALAALDLRLRVVLVMHDFAGHDGASIAEALAIPRKTVYSRLRIARERFAEVAQRLQLNRAAR